MYVNNAPYAVEITYHILLHIDIEIFNNIHRLTVGSYDSNNFLVKTDIIELPIFDIESNVLMPANWPATNPTGAELYNYIESAFYGRLKESHPWLIKEGEIRL